LAFRVTDQPAPMEELSPFDVHPPHLDNFLVSRRGEVRLERLPDGRTRLVGTTWYTWEAFRAVPEPSAAALLLTGSLAFARMRFRSDRKGADVVGEQPSSSAAR
jgi:hypothetical protein